MIARSVAAIAQWGTWAVVQQVELPPAAEHNCVWKKGLLELEIQKRTVPSGKSKQTEAGQAAESTSLVVIEGDIGAGKTHLLQTFAWFVQNLNRRCKNKSDPASADPTAAPASGTQAIGSGGSHVLQEP